MTLLLAVAFAIVVAAIMGAAMRFGRYLLLRQHTNVLAKHLDAANRYAGNRLSFRPPEQSDRSFYLEMATDETAASANGWSSNEVDNVRARFNDPDKFALFQHSELIAVEVASDTPVATLTFTSSPLDRDHAHSIGLHVHHEWRGRGYGRDAMAGGIVYQQVNGVPIHVGTRANNVGMRRIMEQLGYEPFNTTIPYAAPNGETYPAVWYSCGADADPPKPLLS